MLPGSHSTSSLSIISRELWQKTGWERNVATGGFYKLVRSLYVYVAEPSPAACVVSLDLLAPSVSRLVTVTQAQRGPGWPRPPWDQVEMLESVGGVAASAKGCRQQNWPSCDNKLRMTGSCPLVRVTQMRRRREGRTFLTNEAVNNRRHGNLGWWTNALPALTPSDLTLWNRNSSTDGILKENIVIPIGDA